MLTRGIIETIIPSMLIDTPLIQEKDGLIKYMVMFSDMVEKLGTKIIRDLVSKGCTRWRIHKELRVTYNAVTDMLLGKYCADRHVPRLQELRYRFYIEKGLPLFSGE